ncbi:hypothetical protein LCGC14_1843250 [marine sediment metagenome]|uniref:Fibronectin type-III domain-containing protein n=1 Tax=marine sediment metagenome TaxID=412755 RepID=A0A0F9GCQ3_9ZZZZ
MATSHVPNFHFPLKHFPSLHFPGGMALGFYRVYRGVGDITNVDFGTVIAEVDGALTTVSLTGEGHAASTRYTYAVRPVRGGDELETPDLSCAVTFETDGGGDWLGDRPAMVEFLEATVEDGGDIALAWSFRTPYGGSAPNDFGVYYSGTPDITPGSPDATESYTSDGRCATTLTLTGGQTYWFAVTSRSAGGVESLLSEIIGPFVADSTAPGAPDLYLRATL